MRAFVVPEAGSDPILQEFRDPGTDSPHPVGRMMAAALNPLDLVVAAGKMPHRKAPGPFVAGFEGIVDLGGQIVYVAGPPLPFGTLGDLVPVPGELAFPVPAGLDPALAATLGVSGTAAWLALDYRGRLQPGESVLILGAGAVGQLAVQAAKILGAARIVVVDKAKAALDEALANGADAVVDISTDHGAHVGADLGRAAANGYDLVLDLLWGDIVNTAIDHAAMHSRIVQVGNASGPASPLLASVFRNKGMSIIGMSIFATPIDARREAYANLAKHALSGAIGLRYDAVPLGAVDEAWAALKAGSPSKLVVTGPAMR
jgi:NADPH:quinone reductase-like Zn-dependent oxidoreductase